MYEALSPHVDELVDRADDRNWEDPHGDVAVDSLGGRAGCVAPIRPKPVGPSPPRAVNATMR